MSFIVTDRSDMTLHMSTIENNMETDWEGKVYFYRDTENKRL